MGGLEQRQHTQHVMLEIMTSHLPRASMQRRTLTALVDAAGWIAPGLLTMATSARKRTELVEIDLITMVPETARGHRVIPRESQGPSTKRTSRYLSCHPCYRRSCLGQVSKHKGHIVNQVPLQAASLPLLEVINLTKSRNSSTKCTKRRPRAGTTGST